MSTLAPGTPIGPYQIVAPIAQGGMGVVYHARQPSLQRDVAIKILPPQFTQDPEFLARFERESRVLARLRHPNIVQVFDAGSSDDQHYIVMEYLPGGTLAGELATLRKNNDAMPISKAVEIAKQIAAALDYAHPKGVVHRDIKPSNILIAADGRYVLSDFGIVTDNANTKITRTLQTLGTPEYMSPEQANGAAVDGRSDVYSLGVVLYEMLTGAPPFSGSNALSVLNKHLSALPPSLSKIRADIPTWLQSVVSKTLEKLPERRFQAAAEFAAALQPPSTQRSAGTTGRRIPPVALGIGLGVLGMLTGIGLLLSGVISGSGGADRATTTVVAGLPNGSGGTPPQISTPTSNGLPTGGNTVIPPSVTPALVPTPNSPALATLNNVATATITPVSPPIPSGGGTSPPLPPTFTPKPPTATATFTPKPPTITPTFTPTLTRTFTPTPSRTPTKTPSGPSPTPCVPIIKCISVISPGTIKVNPGILIITPTP